MRAPSSRVKRLAALAAIPVSMLFAAGAIWQSSYAAFSAETRNAGSSWSAGAVALTDDDAGSARFSAAHLVSGQTQTRCITVTASADVPGLVKLYLLNPTTSTAGLENHIRLTVSQGTGGGFGSCTGYVSGSTLINDMSLSAATTT